MRLPTFLRSHPPTDDVTTARARREGGLEHNRSIDQTHDAREIADHRFETELMRAHADGPHVNVESLTRALADPRGLKLLRWGGLAKVVNDPEYRATCVVAALMPDVLRAEAAAGFDAFYDTHGEGLTHEERTAQLAECEAEILAAELAEERALRAQEARGESPERRRDADPAITLATDEALRGTTRPTEIDVDRLHAIEDAAAMLDAARLVAAERARDATRDARRVTDRRDSERQSNYPYASPEIRAQTLAALEQAVSEHAVIQERHAETEAAVTAQWDLAATLARACRKYANKLGVDLPRQLEPGSSSPTTAWATSAT